MFKARLQFSIVSDFSREVDVPKHGFVKDPPEVLLLAGVWHCQAKDRKSRPLKCFRLEWVRVKDRTKHGLEMLVISCCKFFWTILHWVWSVPIWNPWIADLLQDRNSFPQCAVNLRARRVPCGALCSCKWRVTWQGHLEWHGWHEMIPGRMKSQKWWSVDDRAI